MTSRTRAVNQIVGNQENVKNNKPLTTIPGQTRRAALGEIGNKVLVQRTNSLTVKSSLKDNNKVLLKKSLATRQVQIKIDKIEKIEKIEKVEKPEKTDKIEKVEKITVPKQIQVQEVKPVLKTEISVVAESQQKNDALKTEIDSNADKKEIIASQITNELVSSDFIDDIDEDDKNNPILVSVYCNEIYDYYRQLEIQYPIHKDFLQGQEVTPRMRCVLIDWLIEVHEQFHLVPETLYLTVSIIDRFLQVFKIITRKRVQLVGITAMFIASKYEEMYSPDIGDFVYIADNSYTKAEILQMELIILKTLDFSLGRPFSLQFLRRYSKAGKALPIHHTLAKYFLEQCLVHYEFSHYEPSLISAAAFYLSMLTLGSDSSQEGERIWTQTLVHYSTYKSSQVVPVASKIATLIVNAEKSKYQAVRRKYSQSKHMGVSLRPELKSPTLARLSA